MNCYVSLQRIPLDIQCAVEHSKDVNVPNVFNQVGDAVVAIKQNAYMPLGVMIAMVSRTCSSSITIDTRRFSRTECLTRWMAGMSDASACLITKPTHWA